MKRFKGLLLLTLVIFLAGFDFSKHSIPRSEIQSGGPPKDGIPAILKPKFVRAEQAAFMEDRDRVLGLMQNGEAKAYPINILNWHEIVNDTVGGRPVLISYCPLCGTGMAFVPTFKGKDYTFGVSGLLYKSDVLMYDHQTESLWSQIRKEAVTGEMIGSRLTLLPLIHTTWKAWKKEHPLTLILSTDTGYHRDYSRDPYSGYEDEDRLFFPVGKMDKRFRPKTWVLGIERNGITKAYPFPNLERGPAFITDMLGSEKVRIEYDRASRTARIKNKNGDDLPTVVAYWFAWTAFHPETEVYEGP
ncbi:MAG: DUF3179 domain-containing protein [Nitrospiria bacterium]